MKSYNGDIRNVIILVLIVVIILLRQCSGDPTPVEPTVITKIETKYDTITKEVPTYIPKVVTRIVREIEIDTITVTPKIDTLSILEDYFATYVYEDIQELDSLNLQITDSISQNKIFFPTTTITETKYINANEFYIGFGVNGTGKQFNYVGGQLLFRTKKQQAYGLGIGIDENLQPMLSTQFLWKLGK